MMPRSNIPKVYSVGEIARRIKSLLEDQLGSVCIEGEVSGFTHPASGHQYFTLKDSQALIKAAWFKGNQRSSSLQLEDGMQVKVYGEISAYAQRSEFQLVVRKVEPAGLGALLQAYEALKKRLEAEGLFSSEHKKTLPFLPRHIGIITSPTGAVIRDMITVLTRRFPHLQITLAPVPVQGAQAAGAMAAALNYFNQKKSVDLILLGRGGGSLEDLWAFNEEILARAVYTSEIPVISAVGHEPDFTICDFVADLRAPTPSAAAELAVPEYEKMVGHLSSQQRHLVGALEHTRHRLIARFARASNSYVFKEPSHTIRRHRQSLVFAQMQLMNQTRGMLDARKGRLDRSAQGVKHHAQRLVQQGQQHVDNLQLRLGHESADLLKGHRARLERLQGQLNALSHQAVLERGYSISRNAKGDVLKDVTQVQSGERLRTELASGTIDSIVETTQTKDDDS